MKTTILLTIIATLGLLVSCNNKVQDKSKIDAYFYITYKSNGLIDTNEYLPRRGRLPNTELICKSNFYFKDKTHIVSLQLIDGPAIDDEGIYYELDSLGMIYSKSLVWPGHTALQTNNDSINEIIDAAKNHILADKNLHCYQCRRYDKSPELILRRNN